MPESKLSKVPPDAKGIPWKVWQQRQVNRLFAEVPKPQFPLEVWGWHGMNWVKFLLFPADSDDQFEALFRRAWAADESKKRHGQRTPRGQGTLEAQETA
jgi:hypothetical protein